MLHREDANGLIIISQPAHAWLSGQLARHWGNDEFVAPIEEVCLAAEQHDVGFLEWERFPTLNRQTGLPHSFLDMPAQMHLDIWTAGVQQMLRFGRYPALLVSMHFTNITRQHWVGEGRDAHLIRQYLAEQDALQASLIDSLRSDAHYGALCGDESVRRNQQLVSILDWMSLLLCLRLREEKVIHEAPAMNATRELKLTVLDETGLRVGVSPWPFREETIRLICEGRRLLRQFDDEQEMRNGLDAAERLTLTFDLVRD